MRGRSSLAHGEVKASEPSPFTDSFCLCFLFFQSFFGLGQGAEIKIELSDTDKRKKVDVKNEEGKKLPLYYDGESVSGRVRELKCVVTALKLDHVTCQ